MQKNKVRKKQISIITELGYTSNVLILFVGDGAVKMQDLLPKFALRVEAGFPKRRQYTAPSPRNRTHISNVLP
jgi:hypothetical protein